MLLYQGTLEMKKCPRSCSVEVLNVILDKAEAAFERGEFVTNEEAEKIIISWSLCYGGLCAVTT